MKKHLILFIGILLGTNLFAGAMDTLWTKTYGGIKEDRGYCVRETNDGGFIIAGYTASFGDGTYDVYLVRTDSSGDTLWTKTFGKANWDWALSIDQTTDGGFVISGAAYPPYSSLNCDAYILRTDSLGDTLWTKTYGYFYDDYGVSIRTVSYGGYVVAGYSSPFDTLSNNVYIIRMDENGDTLWTKIFGGKGRDYSSEIQECSDSGFVDIGFTTSFGAGGFDVYLLRMDKNGDTLWTKTYGGSKDDWGRSVLQLSDGGFIITGATYSFGKGECDLYLIRTDMNGDTLWTKIYGEKGWDEGYSIQPASEGGFIITGVGEFLGYNIFSVYILQINPDGDTLWTKAYGKSGDDEGYSIRQTKDGGCIVTGITTSFGAGGYDVYLLRLNKEIWAVEEKLNIKNQNAKLEIIKNKISLSVPNLSGAKSAVGGLNANITIYDLGGREKEILFSGTLSKGDYVFTPSIKKSGVYFVRLTAGDVKETKKMILVK